ncbi:hypothetical protein H5410_057098 [Solanum commersonii]|uniref:Gag-pol polyprotein n=1 Tax=Solanum commersonii TaxID=4109 RepID=A0A9J5WP57_SOLCO|nr:hypothetical protein H5410_057098 [Solanum commersonii]
MRETKVQEFLTLEHDSLSVHEYSLKSQLSCYASKIVADIRSRMNLFVARMSRLSSKEGKAVILIGDMDIAGLMTHVKKLEKENLRNREEFKNTRAKASGKEFGKEKSNANRSSFQHKQKGSSPSFVGAPASRNKYEARPAQSQGSMAQGSSKIPVCAKCGRNHLRMCCDGTNGCFKCV